MTPIGLSPPGIGTTSDDAIGSLGPRSPPSRSASSIVPARTGRPVAMARPVSPVSAGIG